ncbi:histone-lysine N-methyltransferase EHMT2 isoform X2 [Centroberyx affinis]|uniref:histone-lysine N-methyltransferase EHMT2 isoform X2 n=1 Tax=Centroberyx affinis TaxID=166261 RepID=UPI003A5C1AA9
MRCVVPGCKKRLIQHFHRFPRDKGQCRLWLLAIGHPEYDTSHTGLFTKEDKLRVCSEHFLYSDYIGHTVYHAKLKPGAVPSVFPWSGETRESPVESAELISEIREPPEGNASETQAESLAGPSQVKEGDAASTTAVVAKETEPVCGMPSTSSSQQPGKDVSKVGEESEKRARPSSPPNRAAAGHAAKSITSTSSSSLSSSPSTSSALSPGRAKMSVSGPGSSKSVLPPAPSSSSSSSSSSSTTSSSPSVSTAPPKIHRARKTMNRPPPMQISRVEAPIVPVIPSGPSACLSSDSETAAKRRKLGLLSDSTPERAEKVPDKAQKVMYTKVENLFHKEVEPVAKPTPVKSSSCLGNSEEEEEAAEQVKVFSPSTRDSDKCEDGAVEARLHAKDIEGSVNMSDHSSESETQRGVESKNGTSEFPWQQSDRGKERDTADGAETLGAVAEAAGSLGRSSEYTEVPLGALDIAAADSLTLSPHHEGSDAGETERLEELPLCSCRMEAPRVDSSSHRVSRQCMATESINGELRACTSTTIKGETMRPSSRVPLMVLCDSHRSHMVKHHCCPGCGYFCLAGTFLECCPDQRIAHRFHRGCVTVLGGGRSRGNGGGGGMLFCPHCGEDASEAQEVTIPSFASATGSAATVVTMSASSTTTPSLPPPVLTAPSLTASTGGMKDGTKPERPVSARMRGHGVVTREVEQQQPPQPVASAGPMATVPPAEEGVDSVGPSLCMPNGKPICPSALPPGPSRAALQKAILTQDTERRKKLRFHPRQLYPAAKQGEAQRVLLMLMEGIDPTYQPDSQNKRSALHAAAQRGLLEVCYMLVQAGAKVDAQDKTQRTPLLEAIINNHVEVARYLVQSGASVYHAEDDGYTGLHHAAKLGSLEIVNMLLETGQVDINAQDSGGWTPIIWAAEHKHVDVIRALLNRGADVTIMDKEKNVCLHWASFAGSVDIAELVLNAGCSLASLNMHGDTPLHIASREGFLECVTLFLSRGADIDIINKEGDTPLSLARADTPVWVALQINRKLRRGITNRVLRTERIICSDIAQGYENVPIPCVNAVDDEGCPSDYKYVSENCETSAMNIDRNITHLQHCGCTDDCSSSNCLCGQLSIRCWYDKDQRLLQEFNKIEPPLIFECNLACACYRTCKNRVVQAGIKVRLQLYRTEKMGWGVRALQDIPQGSFICEYVGELISDAEADVREDDSYLFDLDNKDGEVYCIDARYYGNISRFINHLCDPNLIPVRVFMLHQDLRFPRIAFFSSRDILSGQELGFDYGDRFWDIKSKYFTCQCGSEKCKHSAEAIALEQSRLARLEACPESGTEFGMTMLGNS